MAEEIGAILNSPWFDRGLAVVLVFYLLRGMHHDIAMLTGAIIKLDANLNSATAHQTSRMAEIRDHHSEIRSLLGSIQTVLIRGRTGGHDATTRNVPRPGDG